MPSTIMIKQEHIQHKKKLPEMHRQPRVHLHMRQANEKPRYSGKKVDMLIVIIQLTNIKAPNFNYSTC